MTESTENAPEESAETNNLTPETFDFFEVLSGQQYPKDIVELYFDESAAFELDRALRKLQEADPDTPVDDQVKQINDLRERVRTSMFTFHITGVPDDLITDMQQKADDHFKDKMEQRYTADRRLEKQLPKSEQHNYVRYFNALINSAHIEQVVAPDGRVNTAPDVDQVAYLFDKAPTSQKEKLQRAIQNLRVSAETFEAQVGADFLAKP